MAPGGFCYWARLRSTSGTLDAIITNDTVSRGRAFLLVARSDRAVESDGCGVWVPASAKSYNPTPTRMVDGEYRVNIDVWEGTYRAPGGSGCYWTRRSSWDVSNITTVIANHFGPGQQIVTIARSDVGFVTSGCGSWTKIG